MSDQLQRLFSPPRIGAMTVTNRILQTSPAKMFEDLAWGEGPCNPSLP